jgi:outer membrane protein assembly factor BamD (BamD/ComL family)
MRKLRIVFLTIGSLILLFACNQKPKLDVEKQINEKEAILFDASMQFNAIAAEELVKLYLIRVDSMPKDTITADYLFKAADVSINLTNHSRTLILLNRFQNEFPKHEKVAMCLFLKGFVFENQLNDTAQARKVYEEFIYRFPQNEFVEDAKIAIKNLGKSPEDLIREFEKINE